MYPHLLLTIIILLTHCCVSRGLHAAVERELEGRTDAAESVVRSPRSLNQYCSLSMHHTLCKHHGTGPACRGGATSGGVTDAEKMEITSAHNHLRSVVASGQEMRGSIGRQPHATNMMQLVWDAELAAVAQRHADQCRFKHDCSECRAVERFPVGQNLYMSYATDGDLGGGWKEAVYGWFNEVKSFPNSYIDPFTFKHSTGHYSQMMWATTTHVGCGYRFFKEGNWYKKLYICNYGPAGNVVTLPMYMVGPSCLSCPSGSSCSSSYAGLCHRSNDAQEVGYSMQYSSLYPQRDFSKSSRVHSSNIRDNSMRRFDQLDRLQYPTSLWQPENHFRSSAGSSLKEQPTTRFESWNDFPFGDRLSGEETQFKETIAVDNDYANTGFRDSQYYGQFSDLNYFQDAAYDYQIRSHSLSKIEQYFYDFLNDGEDFSRSNLPSQAQIAGNLFAVDALDYF